MPGVDGKPIRLAWCYWAANALSDSRAKSTATHSECSGVHPENPRVTCDCGCHRRVNA